MTTVLIAVGSLVLYLIAYHTYGRFLARKIFRVDADRTPPSVEINDGVDFVPSRRSLVFGHHFTSIAGTGPIVGPAIAVIWGWLPALIWVLVGSIVMGAVHDFGALVVSMRHRGRTIADLSSDVINPRVRLLFLIVVTVGLWIVLAVFGLVIANIFREYPASVWPSVLQIPIAVGLGVWLRRGGSLLVGSIVSVILMYASIVVCAQWDAAQFVVPEQITKFMSPTVFWTLILLVYVSFASILPVHWLLQPRDVINAWQLFLGMGLVVLGLVVAQPVLAAPAINTLPAEVKTPPIMPFLFITIACGAISGFHCLVSSGCSSRQLRSENDAQFVGYGSMLAEGFLAVMVILACCAGFAMNPAAGQTASGAWNAHYSAWAESKGLIFMLKPMIEGSANMLASLGISLNICIAMIAVFVAAFATTTLDSATRLQRYIIAELSGCVAGGASKPAARFLANRYTATIIAVVSAAILAVSDMWTRGADGQVLGLANAGKGGLVLWPVFGATNQLLGGLALLVISAWLVKQNRPAWVTIIPMIFMLAMTGWAITSMIPGFLGGDTPRPHLVVISALMLGAEAWITVEGVILIARAYGARRGAPAESTP